MDKLSMHAYILASPSAEARLAEARRMAAALVCQAPGARPCGACRDCRKALAGIHPDVVTLRREADDKGRERREIAVGQVRALVADAQVMPNEAARRVYVIDPADAMNAQAQNALLKLLEEPPGRAAFLLCAEDPAGLLPTVRSRCALRRVGGEAEPDEAALADARALLEALATDSRAALLRWAAANEGMDGRRAEAMLRAARALLADVLRGEGPCALSARRCAALDALFARCAGYLRLNTGVRHVLGLLAVDGVDTPAQRK